MPIVYFITIACGLAALQPCLAADTQADGTFNTDLQLADDFFPILPWNFITSPKPGDKPANGLESIAECGFTIAGFVQPADLPTCEKLGLKAIIGPPPGKSWAKNAWRNFSDADIDAYVREQVEASRHSPAVIGYYIMDEPGAPAFPALAKAVAAVRRHAPGKLAYINLFPGYATIGAPDKSQLGTASFTEYLERFVEEVKPQYLSYDNYMVQYSDDLQSGPHTAGYFRDLLEVRRIAMKHRLPFWNIVSSNQIRPVTPPPSPANLLLQAYTTLAAGGRGLSWYTYYGGGYGYAPVDRNDRRTETWGYLQMVNRQLQAIGPVMNRLRSTGVFFTAPGMVEDAPLLPGRLVAEVPATTSLRKDTPPKAPLMVGEFAGADGDYVMFVNLSLAASVNIKPKLIKPGSSLNVLSPAGEDLGVLDESHGRWIVPGQGVLMRVTNEKP